jgi:SPP1 family phage portal protein
MVLKGRKMIFTNHDVITDHNVVDVLNHALKIHRENKQEIEYLMDYYRGEQSILHRQKQVRSDVNNQVVINYAQQTTRDIVGYTYGKPITYTQRKAEKREAIRLLNDFVETADKGTSDQEIATSCSICGVGYRGVFPDINDDNLDDVSFNLITLDSSHTFVVYSTQITHTPVLACHYYSKMVGDRTSIVYEVYTANTYYRFETANDVFNLNASDLKEIAPHILGQVPIVEYTNNQWRIGHWEMAISLLDAINLLGSDSVNDVEQFVNSILVATNAEFDEEATTSIKQHKMVSLVAPQPNMTVDLKYISSQLDMAGTEILRQYLEDAYRTVVGIPDRKTKSSGGGDTGDAVKLRDGWANMEIVARNSEMFFKRAEKRVLRLILTILDHANILKDVKLTDVDIKFSRNKTDNIQTKVQSGATLHGMNILDPVDVLELMDISTNHKN